MGGNQITLSSYHDHPTMTLDKFWQINIKGKVAFNLAYGLCFFQIQSHLQKLAMSVHYVKDMIYASTHNQIYIRH